MSPDSIIDALSFSRALVSTPNLLITWEERRPGWQYPIWGDPVLHTIARTMPLFSFRVRGR